MPVLPKQAACAREREGEIDRERSKTSLLIGLGGASIEVYPSTFPRKSSGWLASLGTRCRAVSSVRTRTRCLQLEVSAIGLWSMFSF